jgi:hypothetical protein
MNSIEQVLADLVIKRHATFGVDADMVQWSPSCLDRYICVH